MPEHFIPLDVATKLAISLGVGLLIGLEREWSRKDVGVRTFALTALMGTLSSLISISFALGGLGAIALLILLVNSRALLVQQNLEITTSVSLLVNLCSVCSSVWVTSSRRSLPRSCALWCSRSNPSSAALPAACGRRRFVGRSCSA